MPHYRAAWLVPVSQPPIRDAWLRTEGGRIVAFGHSRPGDFTAPDEIDLGDCAILPGLVNAHTHLELSWMRGRLPEATDFTQWIRSLLEIRGRVPLESVNVSNAIAQAVEEARAFGTALIGDISNTLSTSSVLAAAGMPACVFHELLGFQSADAAEIANRGIEDLGRLTSHPDVRHSLAPHAPYSVSPALFAQIRATIARDPRARSSVHVGESEAEVAFLRDGSGPYRSLLDALGKWDSTWSVPRCGPLEYVDRMGFVDERILLVHGVQFASSDLARIASAGATLVTCPRGNIRTGAGVPPIDDFFDAGIRVAVGTDSLASVPDLNVFAELAEMRRLAPNVPARRLLESVTMNGARALGFGDELGTIDAGKRDALIAVQLDVHEGNVEESLVSGIDAGQIRWLSAA